MTRKDSGRDSANPAAYHFWKKKDFVFFMARANERIRELEAELEAANTLGAGTWRLKEEMKIRAERAEALTRSFELALQELLHARDERSLPVQRE